MIFQIYHVLLSMIVFFCMSQIIGCIRFFLQQVTYIFFISQYPKDYGIRPQSNSFRAHAFFQKFTGNNMCSFSFIHIFMENCFDNGYFFFVNKKFSIMNCITKQISAKNNTFFHLPFLSPANPFGRFS